MATRDSIWTVLLIQRLLPLTALALPATLSWRPVPAIDVALVLAAGALGTAGLLGVTWAITRLEASRLAPIDYTGFVWAALIGYFGWGEIPTAATLTSAALIIAGCLLLLRR